MRIAPRIAPETLRKLLSYDPHTGVFVWKERGPEFLPGLRGRRAWNAKWAGREAFKIQGNRGYLLSTIFNHPELAHRVAWAIYHGEWPASEIDHINGCKTDNRLSNLRHVSSAENNLNQPRRCDNSSGITGVYFAKRARKWVAQISLNRLTRVIGSFDTLHAAAEARKAAEREMGFHENHGRP